MHERLQRAARLRAPTWRNGRFVTGVVLVLASVAVGARVVAAADDTVPVWAASTALAPGRALVEGDLRVVRVRLGSGVASYLTVADPVPSGSVLVRSLRPGELLPVSALAPPGAWSRRPVVVPLTGPAPDQVQVGALVDVWASARDPAPGATAAYRPPLRLAQAVEVSAVSPAGTGLGAAQGSNVQVLLGERELRSALDALANGARVALVPVPGAPPGGAAGGAAGGVP